LTPTKIDLNATVKSALIKMPKDAEQELLKAFTGQGSYAKAGDAYTDKKHLAILADALGFISRPGGRDAVLAALPAADTDTTRTAFAQSLVQFPKDPRSEPAFQAAYKKESWTAQVDFLGALNPRSALAQVAAQFYDATTVDWLLKEAATAPDSPAKLLAWESALKVMPAGKKDDVAGSLHKITLEPEYAQPVKQMLDYASQTVEKCGTQARCYVGLLDEPIPSTPKTANFRAVKAAWMAGVYGDDATRAELVKRVDKTKNAEARLAIVEAIDALAPKGDVAAADALDKIVASDKGGDAEALMADDSVVKIALRLRARAVP
jgi:hypothetical protein